MKLQIAHSTEYSYSFPVNYALQQVRLTPKKRPGIKVEQWDIAIDGGQAELSYLDQNNNLVHLIGIEQGAEKIAISISGVVETTDNAGVIGKHSEAAPKWYFKRATDLTKPGPRTRKLAKSIDVEKGTDIERLHELSDLVRQEIRYEKGKTDIFTNAETALEHGHGVCQDHAHAFLTAARLLNYSARYVSGYLLLADQIDQEASHAWTEVFVPDLGWVGFDISNGYSPDERYVALASGLDYLEACPISGIRLGNSDESMVVSLQVQQ